MIIIVKPILQIFVVCLFCIASLLSSLNAWAFEEIPFAPGERLVFQLKWIFVPAGEAVVEVLPYEKIDGRSVHHFVMTARSNSYLDTFYRVRDRIDAYTDMAMNGSVLYIKKQREGSTKRDERVIFDQENLKAYYHRKKKNKNKEIEIIPGTFDPLAVFFFTRTINISVGMQIKKPVSDGHKVVIGKAKIVKREKIKVPAGKFDTFLLEPELKHIGGVFEKSKGASIKVWVTADKRRIPVRLTSKVSVGYFTGELVSAKGLK